MSSNKDKTNITIELDFSKDFIQEEKEAIRKAFEELYEVETYDYFQKAIEPVTLLIIVIVSPAVGFFTEFGRRLGSDAYTKLKSVISGIFSKIRKRKHEDPQLVIEYTINGIKIEASCTSSDQNVIETALENLVEIWNIVKEQIDTKSLPKDLRIIGLVFDTEQLKWKIDWGFGALIYDFDEETGFWSAGSY